MIARRNHNLFVHLGLPVPAECARVPVVDRLMTSINAQDSLSRGESSYLAEVRRVREVVRAVASGETVIALLDEAFRGTRSLASASVIRMYRPGACMWTRSLTPVRRASDSPTRCDVACQTCGWE